MSGRLSPSQRQRHASLAALGHDVEVIKAATESDAAQQAIDLVRGWLGQEKQIQN